MSFLKDSNWNSFCIYHLQSMLRGPPILSFFDFIIVITFGEQYIRIFPFCHFLQPPITSTYCSCKAEALFYIPGPQLEHKQPVQRGFYTAVTWSHNEILCFKSLFVTRPGNKLSIVYTHISFLYFPYLISCKSDFNIIRRQSLFAHFYIIWNRPLSNVTKDWLTFL